MSCKRCGSWAINHGHHGRDGSDPELCDVCYWRKRTEAKDAELAGYVEANRHMAGELDDALEDARRFAEAQREIARLREALEWLLSTVDRQTWSMSRFHAAKDKARAALTQVAEVGK